MEITNVIIINSFIDFFLKNEGLCNFLSITFSIIIVIIGVIFFSFKKTKNFGFYILLFSFLPLILLICTVVYLDYTPEIYDPSWGYDAYNRYGYDNIYCAFDGKTDKYIVEYNQENSKETMTTKEIIDAIYNQRYFKDKKGKTSKVIIYVKGRENIKLIKHILEMNDNTNFINEKEQKTKEQEENDKFLEETHVINDKK